MQTYSIKEAAAIIRGPGPDGTAATVEHYKVKWLAARLRGETGPRLPGYKAGRDWRMTADDVEAAIEALRPRRDPEAEPTVYPEGSFLAAMTEGSRRRLLFGNR